MNESGSELYRSAGLGIFIGAGVTALLFLLAGCSPEAHAQPALPSDNSPKLISSYSGIFNLTATTPVSASLVAPTSISKRGTVTLAWSASLDLSTAGYRLYWGTNSSSYPYSLNVGTNNTARLSNLDEGTRYYFATTAYDAIGVESPFSNEATTVTGFYIALAMKVWQVESYGMPGKTNLLQTATNLTDWRTILTWVGNGNATNVLYTNGSVSNFRVMVR